MHAIFPEICEVEMFQKAEVTCKALKVICIGVT